jgi:hypothetical protein
VGEGGVSLAGGHLAAKPRAELLLMIVPPVRKLVEAAQKGSL